MYKRQTEGFKKPDCTEIEVETDGENPQHPGVLNAFAGKILRGTPLVAEGVEGIKGLTLSNAMHLSSWLNKPVDIPFDEDLFYEELKKMCIRDSPIVILFRPEPRSNTLLNYIISLHLENKFSPHTESMPYFFKIKQKTIDSHLNMRII